MTKFNISQRGKGEARDINPGKSIHNKHIPMHSNSKLNLANIHNYLHNRTKNLPFFNRIPFPPTHPQFPLSIHSDTHFHLHTLNNHNSLP